MMEHDPMVDLLSYVHAKTHSLETQDLCDRAWKHYKKVIAERDKLKQTAERVDAWEVELLQANDALKVKNSWVEAELENLRSVVNKTIEHIDYVVSHRTEIYVVPVLRDIKQLLTTQDNEDKCNE